VGREAAVELILLIRGFVLKAVPGSRILSAFVVTAATCGNARPAESHIVAGGRHDMFTPVVVEREWLSTKGDAVMRPTVRILGLAFLLVGMFSSPGAAMMSGSFDVGVPPWGPPDYDFLYYGLGNINLSGDGVSIVSNDGDWGSYGNGWPGVVLDKIFFSPASTTTGGLFIADVSISLPWINGGDAFPGVINPDILPPEVENTSGAFTGDPNDPDTFTFTALPIYAVVPQDPDNMIVPFPSDFESWDYGTYLYGNFPWDPNFSLAEVGTLSLTASRPRGSFVASGSFVPTVPEPATGLLVGAALIVLAVCGRKRFFS
jgi:hypothetical protein